MPRNRLLLGLAAGLAFTLAGCGGGPEERTLFVLLTDNRLLRLSEEGEVRGSTRLGPSPALLSRGSLLAASPDGQRIYALVRGPRQHVAAIDSRGTVNGRLELPRGVVWRRLAVGRETGRIYLAGNVAGTRRNELGAIELGVRLLVLSPTGRTVARRVIREPEGRDWYVAWLTVAPDESSLLVTYHGTDTTGSDLVALDPLQTCRDRTPVWGGCLARNHGRAQWAGGEILAATGEAELALLDPSGRVARELRTGLRDVHLMEFALAGETAYAFADCVKGTGVAGVPLDGSKPERFQGCGDVGALLDDSTLVLGRRFGRDPYGRGRDASLLFVDLDGGKPRIAVELPEDPADVLAVG